MVCGAIEEDYGDALFGEGDDDVDAGALLSGRYKADLAADGGGRSYALWGVHSGVVEWEAVGSYHHNYESHQKLPRV